MKLKSAYLTNYKYYQYIVNIITSLNSNLCIPLKNRSSMFDFASLILK